MQQIGLDAPGKPDVLRLEEAPVPAPRSGEVLIRVEAAGVNRPDVLQRLGKYPVPADASPVLGLEVAGTVAALGSGVHALREGVHALREGVHALREGVRALREGDRVCALVNGGGYAEYCVVPEVQCLPWPAGYTAVQAAGVPETFFTVWANLFGHGRLQPGETVLIHGGSSGIGTTAIALAQAFGAHPIATAGTAAKCAACEALGARTINYRVEDFVAAVDRLTEGRGVDVVLDIVAGSYLSGNMQCLRRDGRLVVIGTLGGTRDPEFDIRLVMMKRLVITGSTMRARSTAEKGAVAAELRERVWPLLDEGKCAPVIDSVFPLENAALAHALMESGANIGKIVLTVAA